MEAKEFYLVNNAKEEYGDLYLEYINDGYIEKLNDLVLDLSQIENWGSVGAEITSGGYVVPYTTYWFQIDETYDGKSNVLLLATIPRKLSINIKELTQ